MALAVTYGIKKNNLDDVSYFKFDFDNEHDRQYFYFGSDHASYTSVQSPTEQHIAKIICEKIEQTIVRDKLYTGPVSFLMGIIDRLSAVAGGSGCDEIINNFLTAQHIIQDFIVQAKKTLHKISTHYNVLNLDSKNLVQAYCKRTLRVYTEQLIYLTTWINGLKADYPAVFESRPTIIEDTLAACIAKYHGGHKFNIVAVLDDDVVEKRTPRHDWFRSMFQKEELFTRDDEEFFRKTVSDYLTFIQVTARIPRHHTSKINHPVTLITKTAAIKMMDTAATKKLKKQQQQQKQQGTAATEAASSTSSSSSSSSSSAARTTKLDIITTIKRYAVDNEVAKADMLKQLRTWTTMAYKTIGHPKKKTTAARKKKRTRPAAAAVMDDADNDDDDDDDDNDDDDDDIDTPAPSPRAAAAASATPA